MDRQKYTDTCWRSRLNSYLKIDKNLYIISLYTIGLIQTNIRRNMFSKK